MSRVDIHKYKVRGLPLFDSMQSSIEGSRYMDSGQAEYINARCASIDYNLENFQNPNRHWTGYFALLKFLGCKADKVKDTAHELEKQISQIVKGRGGAIDLTKFAEPERRQVSRCLELVLGEMQLIKDKFDRETVESVKSIFPYRGEVYSSLKEYWSKEHVGYIPGNGTIGVSTNGHTRNTSPAKLSRAKIS